MCASHVDIDMLASYSQPVDLQMTSADSIMNASRQWRSRVLALCRDFGMPAARAITSIDGCVQSLSVSQIRRAKRKRLLLTDAVEISSLDVPTDEVAPDIPCSDISRPSRMQKCHYDAIRNAATNDDTTELANSRQPLHDNNKQIESYISSV